MEAQLKIMIWANGCKADLSWAEVYLATLEIHKVFSTQPKCEWNLFISVLVTTRNIRE